MDEIEEIKVYQFEGTLTEVWVGDDEIGGFHSVIKGESSDDLIRDFHQLLKTPPREDDRNGERKILVRIELL